jgi:uncharacterized repeat protein (TIGR01451 family)
VLLAALLVPGIASGQSCAIPGSDGPGGTLTGVVNTYFPGVQANVPAGATAVQIGAGTGAANTVNAGDLLLFIQMQGAAPSFANDATYGSGFGAPQAGLYEFAIATNNVGAGGGTVALAAPLVNSYANAAATSTSGQYRFQVIRVPQYSTASLSSGLTASPWNGTTGGVLAIDVAGQLTLGGTASVSNRGFRGGGAQQLGGQSGVSNATYRVAATTNAMGSKGEGIAGTPRYVWDGTAVVDTAIEGYPNGSLARGAPANAGGGGNDANPAANDENTGGGGGGNGGAGGKGGNSWSSNLPLGGFGAASLGGLAPQRLFMGGGGGAGTRNNSSGGQSSGGRGGGIVFIRAGSVTGTGTIAADGESPPAPENDGGGGGGAGGTIVVQIASGGLGGLAASAQGGRGADAWASSSGSGFPGNRHGPGGGGGGGIVLTNAAPGSVSTAAGASGISTSAGDTYGAVSGSQGTSSSAFASAQTPGSSAGAQCLPQLTVTKQTLPAGPLSAAPGTNVTYRITVTNAAGRGTATGVALSDAPLPGAPNAFTNQSATPTIALAGGATRTSTANAAVGATSPVWSAFRIPGGGSVRLDFTANIPANVAPATYQNAASAIYTDPARTTVNGTATTPSDAAASTAEDVVVGLPTLGTPQVFGSCPAGTSTSAVNLVTNGSFAAGATGFTAVAIAAPDTYPADTRVAVQNGAKNYAGGAVAQSVFPGDAASNVAASTTWLYANGNATGSPYVVWQQTLAGLSVGTTYVVSAYVSNAQNPGGTATAPALQFWAGGAQVPGVYTVANESTTVGDRWTRVQWSFVATANTVTLQLRDAAASVNGDDLALTQIAANACQSSTRVGGRVFRDNGAPSGTANDGLLNGAEAGIGNATVMLTNCAGTTYQTTTTDGAGNYLFAPAGVAGSVCVQATTPTGSRSTGASAGTTVLPSTVATNVGGTVYTYDRTLDRIQFTLVAGTSHTNLNFGDVPDSTFVTDGAQSTAPSTNVYYPHTFVAGTAGQLALATTASANPALPGWSEVLHVDANCNGRFDAGEPQYAAPIAVVAGQQVCVLVKEFVPATAPLGAQNVVAVTASFTYANAAPGIAVVLTRTDTTTVARAGLLLVKSVSSAQALPGAALVYTLSYTNNSSEALANLVIRDATPAFTTHVSAGCPAPPSGLTCGPLTAPVPGATGPIVWSFGGVLNPGASGTVTFTVLVNN